MTVTPPEWMRTPRLLPPCPICGDAVATVTATRIIERLCAPPAPPGTHDGQVVTDYQPCGHREITEPS